MKNIICQLVFILLLLEAVENNVDNEISNRDESLVSKGEQLKLLSLTLNNKKNMLYIKKV